MLRMRRILVASGGGYAVLPHGRPLVSYYANGVAHLLGPFEAGVRARDMLPALAVTGEHMVEQGTGVRVEGRTTA
jgi:hypothetical protein